MRNIDKGKDTFHVHTCHQKVWAKKQMRGTRSTLPDRNETFWRLLLDVISFPNSRSEVSWDFTEYTWTLSCISVALVSLTRFYWSTVGQTFKSSVCCFRFHLSISSENFHQAGFHRAHLCDRSVSSIRFFFSVLILNCSRLTVRFGCSLCREKTGRRWLLRPNKNQYTNINRSLLL